MPRKRLKKSEYPENIECLCLNCLTMCNEPKKFGGYSKCPKLKWKQENMNKYDISVNKNGNIVAVYEN